MLLVADEVQSGMGRTGKMFAMEHFGVEPDIIATAKGIASGMPLGVCCARAEVMNWPPGAHASTFGGNPVSCAAAIATIKLLRDSLVKNAADVGAHLLAGARELMEKHQIIGDVRGKGLMIGIEFVKDRQTKERAVAERDAVVQACFYKGLLVLGAGKNAIRLSPVAGDHQGAGGHGAGDSGRGHRIDSPVRPGPAQFQPNLSALRGALGSPAGWMTLRCRPLEHHVQPQRKCAADGLGLFPSNELHQARGADIADRAHRRRAGHGRRTVAFDLEAAVLREWRVEAADEKCDLASQLAVCWPRGLRGESVGCRRR